MRVEEVREQYESMAADDKEMDRSFKKDFSDCEPHVDQLYKLFRKRPRGQKAKGGSIVPGSMPQNVFSLRRSTSGPLNEDPMADMDNVAHMPEGLETHLWDRFVAHRHRKVESESKVCMYVCMYVRVYVGLS